MADKFNPFRKEFAKTVQLDKFIPNFTAKILTGKTGVRPLCEVSKMIKTPMI